MKMRKLLALVMALCLLAGHLPATAWAAEETPVASGTCGDNLTWTLDDTGLLTISGTGEMTSAPWLTDHAASITAVHMEQGITSIYKSAFSSCTNLVEVSIPEGVTAIGNSAFYGCTALPELTLPRSLRSIGKSAFSDCDALTEMVIPEGVTEILLDTFAGCYKLASVTVPSTVTSIDQCAFLSCPSLKSFVFPEGIGIVEFELFMNCYGLESVTIPSSVCVIKACAFQDCDRLGEVTIPECVFSIGDYAFYKSGITALWVGHGGEVDRTLGSNTIPSIPDGIGRYSFSSCSSLTVAEIGPEIRQIGEYAFAYSALTQCAFLGDIPTIDATAFFDVTATVYYPLDNATYTEETMLDYGGTLTWVAYEQTEEVIASGVCGDDLIWTLDETGLLTVSGTGDMYDYGSGNTPPWEKEKILSAVIGEGVTSIGSSAFSGCYEMKSVTLPNSISRIGWASFSGCENLSDITIPNGVCTIEGAAFCECFSLTEIVIPDSVTGVIATDTFWGCSNVTSVVIGNGITEIEGASFSHCSSLTHVMIGSGVTIIDSTAFYNCGNLIGFLIDEDNAAYSSDSNGALLNKDQTKLIRVPGTIKNYTVPNTVTTIGTSSFELNTNLTEVTIPNNVETIEETAFNFCDNLTDIIFEGDAPTFTSISVFSGVIATAYYPAGNATYTEETMLDYGGDLTWVAYEVEEEPFALSGTSVSLGDSLDMHFFIDPSYVDADCYAVLTRYYSSGTDEVTVTVPYSDWNTLDDGRLYVTYGNIAAKEMGDYVTVEICDGEGNAISDLYVDSVKSYTMRMLEKEEVVANWKLRTLYVDMLNYGAAAQAQFGYNVTMLANDLLTEEQLAYATASCETESNLVSGTGRAGTSLTLKSRITLDFIFKNTAIGTDYTGLYAVATYTDHYGNEIETRIDTVKVFNANLGYVSVPGLAVADYGQAVTCTVYDAEGNILAWATDSMEGYAHRMKGSLPQIVEAIVKFGNSSYNYFH